jgi:hypothetical protein
MTRMLWLGLALIFCSGLLSQAQGLAPNPPLAQGLASVPRLELPSRVTELIRSASPVDRQSVASNLVWVAVRLNPRGAPILVGTIAGSVSEVAPVATGAAIQQQPALAAPIARAGASAAPEEVESIVLAALRAAPDHAGDIVRAVLQALPGSGRAILKAVASAFPEMKPGIDSSLASSGDKPISVEGVLDSVSLALSAQGKSYASPQINRNAPGTPPFMPLLGSADRNIKPGQRSGTDNGRNYATP